MTFDAGLVAAALANARTLLERAMQTKPENRAAYSHWIAAHEHILAATKLLDLDSVEQINMRDWRLQEWSLGCTEHDGDMCTLLVNKLDGRQLHIPGTITGLEEKPNG